MFLLRIEVSIVIVVEEMEINVPIFSFNLGWCINCHRETNVKVEGNAYYEKIHAELSKKYGVDKLTAAQWVD